MDPRLLQTKEGREKSDQDFKEFLLCLALAIAGYFIIPYIMDFMGWMLGY